MRQVSGTNLEAWVCQQLSRSYQESHEAGGCAECKYDPARSAPRVNYPWKSSHAAAGHHRQACELVGGQPDFEQLQR